MDMGFPAERTQLFHVSIKLAQPISGPQNCGQKFYGHEDFSEKLRGSFYRGSFRKSVRVPIGVPAGGAWGRVSGWWWGGGG